MERTMHIRIFTIFLTLLACRGDNEGNTELKTTTEETADTEQADTEETDTEEWWETEVEESDNDNTEEEDEEKEEDEKEEDEKEEDYMYEDCSADFDPTMPCEGSWQETICIYDDLIWWCEDGVWMNENDKEE